MLASHNLGKGLLIIIKDRCLSLLIDICPVFIYLSVTELLRCPFFIPTYLANSIHLNPIGGIL